MEVTYRIFDTVCFFANFFCCLCCDSCHTNCMRQQQQPRQLEQECQAATVKWIKSISSYSSNVSVYAGVSHNDPKPHLATAKEQREQRQRNNWAKMLPVCGRFNFSTGGPCLAARAGGMKVALVAAWLTVWIWGGTVGHAAQQSKANSFYNWIDPIM